MTRGILVGLGGGAAIIALAVGLFLALGDGDDTTVYRVPSEAMEPTLGAGETIEVDVDVYKDGSPEIGDVITFNPPRGAIQAQCGEDHRPEAVCPLPTSEHSDLLFIKRVVALPGDEIAIVDGVPVVNGEPASEAFTRACRGGGGCDFPVPVTVAPDHYFVLGDNRGASDDSRFWGPVPQEWIQGRVEE